MKYKVYRTASGTDVEVKTDHMENKVVPTKGIPRTFLRKEKGGIVYSFGNCRWTILDMVALFRWLNPYTMAVVDELRFYSELSAMGLSHLD